MRQVDIQVNGLPEFTRCMVNVTTMVLIQTDNSGGALLCASFSQLTNQKYVSQLRLTRGIMFRYKPAVNLLILWSI